MDTNHDYRKDTIVPTLPRSYFHPSGAAETTRSLEKIFLEESRMVVETELVETELAAARGAPETVPVMMGRSVKVSRANARCGWFSFEELCSRPLGAADYISVSKRFPVVIVDNIPQLGGSYYNEARRFVTLIDTFYEAKCRLVIASHVEMDNLFVPFETELESKDGDEEIALEEESVEEKSEQEESGEELGAKSSMHSSGSRVVQETAIQNQRGDEESWVSGEGGSSSSSSTTMIKTKDGDMEWSATGRIGVSLAQLSAVKDVVFSFKRAESRLAEMSGENWGRSQ
jgi:predicted ATPase